MNILFVFGPSRSGTTLLATRLAAHGGGVAPPELQFIYSAINSGCFSPDESLDFNYAYKFMLNEYSFHNLCLSHKDIFLAEVLFKESSMRFCDFCYAILKVYSENICRNTDTSFIVEHSPVSRRYVSQLVAYFPNSKFVGIIRDPRAVFSSLKKLHWGPNTAEYFSIWWKNAILDVHSAKYFNAQLVKVVNFEDYVSNPDFIISDIFSFHNITSSDSLNVNYMVSSYTKEQHKLVAGKIDITRSQAWKKELNKTDITIIESNCKDAMKYHGYNLYTHAKTSKASRIINAIPEKPLYYYGRLKQYFRQREVTMNSNLKNNSK